MKTINLIFLSVIGVIILLISIIIDISTKDINDILLKIIGIIVLIWVIKRLKKQLKKE